MRVRALPLLGAVFLAATLATAFVAAQLLREPPGRPPRGVAAAPGAGSSSTPPVERAATASDGALEVHVTEGGKPRAGALVRAYLARPDGAWRVAGEARTGPDGVARVLARPGAYLVAARAEGLATGRAEAARLAGEASTRIEVALAPAAALVGRVTARGRALAGARVSATQVTSPWPGSAAAAAPADEVAVGVSDATGAFRVDGMAPGFWAVSLDAAGHHPLHLPLVAVPGEALAVTMEPLATLRGTVRGADGRPVAGAIVRAASADHGAGATADEDGAFVLSAPAGSWRLAGSLGDRAGAAGPLTLAAGATSSVELRLGPAAAIEGEVVRAGSSRPVPGARVAVLLHETGESLAQVDADAAGRFRVAGLAPGPVDVRATAPGASPASATGVTLRAGGRFPLRLALAETGAVEGLVTDPAGRPLAGVRVRVVSRGDGLVAAAANAGGAPLETRTGFDGTWRIEGIEAGRAELVARQEGVRVGTSRSVRVLPRGASRVELVLPAAGLLAGRVVAEGGPPPAGTVVVAVAMNAGPGGLQVARAPADAAGHYALALPAGQYRVQAEAGAVRPDLRATPAFGRVEPGRTARLDLVRPRPAAEGGVEILVLEPGGAPSPGAVVTLTRPGDATVAFATSAGEDGRVVVARDMGVAGRRVAIRARNGARTGAATVELPLTGTVPVSLSPGGALRGVVRGGRRAVDGFTVEVSSRPEPGGWRTVDVHRFSGDRFELGDLPPEPLRLVVRSADGRRGEAQLSVGAGEVRSLEVALE